jgi:hypothetical protein
MGRAVEVIEDYERDERKRLKDNRPEDWFLGVRRI